MGQAPSVPLPEQEARVWCLETESLAPARVQSFSSLLDASEREQIGQLAFEADRVLHTAAHALLRLALSDATGAPPDSWRFERLPGGKPVIATGLSGPVFNLTHTTGLAACVVAARGHVGIDAEFDRGGHAPMEVAPSVYTMAERGLLAELDGRVRAEAFYDLWTLKEAAMKAVGLGFALEPRELEARIDPPAVAGKAIAGTWSFGAVRPTGRHHLAVACSEEAAIARLRWRSLDGAWQDLAVNRSINPPAAR